MVEFHQILHMHLYCKLYLGIITQHISDICTRALALDLCQNYVSAHYLEKKLTYFHKVLQMHSY